MQTNALSTSPVVNIRRLKKEDLAALVNLHHSRLSGNNLSTLIPMATYGFYKTTIVSPFGFTLVAVDEKEKLLGFLMGATDPSRHSRFVLIHNWCRILFAVSTRIFDRQLRIKVANKIVKKINSKHLIGIHEGHAKITPTRKGVLTYGAVTNEAEGYGVFTKLLTSSFEIMRMHNLNSVVLYVYSDKYRARKLYDHLGWIKISESLSKCAYMFDLEGTKEK